MTTCQQQDNITILKCSVNLCTIGCNVKKSRTGTTYLWLSYVANTNVSYSFDKIISLVVKQRRSVFCWMGTERLCHFYLIFHDRVKHLELVLGQGHMSGIPQVWVISINPSNYLAPKSPHFIIKFRISEQECPPSLTLVASLFCFCP